MSPPPPVLTTFSQKVIFESNLFSLACAQVCLYIYREGAEHHFSAKFVCQFKHLQKQNLKKKFVRILSKIERVCRELAAV